MKKHIVQEAQRCLQCKKPACVGGCPVNTPINIIIEKFLSGKILEAGQLLFENGLENHISSKPLGYQISLNSYFTIILTRFTE